MPRSRQTSYCKTTLANGLRVVTAPMPHTRSVSVSVYVGAGSRYELPEQSGLSHFLEHLCFKGTAKRPTPRSISEAIDSVGGVLNAGTDRELTVYYCKVARPHLELALDVLVDMVRRPLLDPGEMEKERGVIIEELASVADSPAQQVDILLDRTLWPDQPLGWDVAGSEATISAITRDTALEYLQRQYVPNNVVVSVAGAVEHAEIVRLAEEQMGDWRRGSPSCWFPAVNGQDGPRAAVLYKKTEQAHISAAVPGLSSWHPDRFALDLLSVVMGETMSSRLFQELREKRSLCYDVHTYVTHFLDAGAFTVYAGVDPARAEEAIVAALQELARVRDEGLPEEELAKAKELSKGRLLLRMEDTRSVSGWYGGQEILNGRILTADEVVGLLDAVTVDDIRRVAGLLTADRLNLAVVGPFRSDKRFLPLMSL